MSDPTTLPDVSGAVVAQRHFWRPHSAIWVALVLWLASNAFVTAISKMATWEGNASYYTMADLCRWDCNWYRTVLQSGYHKEPYTETGEADWGFHPLFPLTAYPLRHVLKLSVPASLVMSSKLALLFAIYGFLLLLSDQTETTGDRFRAGSLVAFNPCLIYAHAGYAEPLYFALLTFAFWLAGRKQWISSGATGAFFSATRLTGFLFSISYAVIWLRDVGWRPRWRKLDPNQLIGLLLCPLGTAIYMLYLYHHVGDALAQVHIHVAWVRLPLSPVNTFWTCITGHHWLRLWGAMIVAGFVASAWLFKLRKPELGIFLALSVLISISGGAYGIPRYIWWQPPFLYAIYCVLKRHPGGWVVYLAFAAGLASFMVSEWFSGHNFVA